MIYLYANRKMSPFLLAHYSRKDIFRLLIIWSAISSIAYVVLVLTNYFQINEPSKVDLSNNYFQSVNDLTTGGFLVDNDKCKIPDVNPWSPGVLPLISKVSPFDCHNQPYFNLTYAQNSMLIINEDVLKPYGYGLDDISCCYKTIKRIEQSISKYTRNADNKYRYSRTCFQMEKFTKPSSGFVKVTCLRTNIFHSVLYENYHLIPLLPEKGDESDSKLSRKLSFWKKYIDNKGQQGNPGESIDKHVSNVGKPPNIVIIGLDSTSRLNFHRFMNRTMTVFRDVIKPVEMRGFTKVGENTFPNLVPLFSSFSEDELRKICYPSRWTPQDSCPYIWKLFSENNYLTALLDDAPGFSHFNYMKTAFIKKPVDMYIRPFMLAVYKDREDNPMKSSCLRYQRPEEIIMNYIVDLASIAHSRRIPYFIMSWLTDLTHNKMNNLQAADDLIAESLLQLHDKGLLQNTILFVMGDHGYRFLDVRQTGSGWFEDKLPTLWIKLPEPVTTSNPSWLGSLKYNANQLVTTFDLHEILRDVFNKYVRPAQPLLKSRNISSLRGISPFTKIPSRTCEEAGIPGDYCSCYFPVEYKSNRTFIKLAAEYVIRSINSGLPPECRNLSAAVITASGTYTSHETLLHQGELQGNASVDFPRLIIVAVRTYPGDFYFEAQVSFNPTKGEFDSVSHILRMNRITQSTRCLNSSDVLDFEQLCYCD